MCASGAALVVAHLLIALTDVSSMALMALHGAALGCTTAVIYSACVLVAGAVQDADVAGLLSLAGSVGFYVSAPVYGALSTGVGETPEDPMQ